MACLHKDSCELFRLIQGSGALAIWKKHYCDGDFQSCQRYQSALDGKKIPLNLLPNGTMIRLPQEMLDRAANNG